MMRYAACALAMTLALLPAVAQNAGNTSPGGLAPINEAPNPYRTIKGYFQLPAGRVWGSTSAVEIDRDGRSIWVAERCGQNNCFDRQTGRMSDLPVILKFDANGTLLASFGAGLLVFPHGFHVDRDGNIWVTDGQDNGPARAAAAPGSSTTAPVLSGPIGPLPGATRGNQVWKFSPDGKVLLTLGKPGGAASPDYFYQPNDVVTDSSGNIYVSEGHGAGNNRIFKFDPAGKLIKTWGKLGSGPGEFDGPHALVIDSRGRLLVGDRNNNRIQVFDLDGNYISEMRQFSRPSGLYIRDDILYVADSESESVAKNHDGWRRGIRWGSLKDGKVTGFIPDPVLKAPGTSAAEGVAVDAAGNIYGAEVGPKGVARYVRN
jgi:DNA-binding beta-propeller fold protein YncE